MTGIPRQLRRQGVPEEYLASIIREMGKRTEDISSDEQSEFVQLLPETENSIDTVTKITEGVSNETNNILDVVLARLFVDRSWISNLLNMTDINAPTLTGGIFGAGATFVAASSQRIESSGDHPWSDFGTAKDFVLACHVKTTSNTMALINKGDITGASYLLGIDASGKPFATISDGSPVTITGATSVNDGLRHSIVASFSRAGNVTLYVDGASDATPVSISGVGNIDNTNKLYIGVRDSGATLGQYYDGELGFPLISAENTWTLAQALAYNSVQTTMTKNILYMLLETNFSNTPDGTFPFVLV